MGNESHDFSPGDPSTEPQKGPSWSNPRWPLVGGESEDEFTQALDPTTMKLAIKEAAIPGLIGLVVLFSVWTNRPLIRLLIYNPTVLNVEKVHAALLAHQSEQAFETRLRTATLMLAGTFFFSSFMNYVLAKWIVVSESGTEAFNEELGRMTLLSYPMIAIPSMIMMIAVFFYLINSARKMTGLDLTEMLNHGEEQKT